MEKEAERWTAFQDYIRESYNICLISYTYFQSNKPWDVLVK